MTDPADRSAFRHPAVYRTVRGLALSGSRALPATGRHSGNPALAAPLRIGTVLQVRPASELAVPYAPAFSARSERESDDSAGVYDARRYSEPND